MKATVLLLLAAGCREAPPPRRLVLAAFTAPQEVYEESIFPAFREHWQAETGETIELVGSFRASGAQTRALLAGFPADVAALSLEPDLDQLAQAGLIRHDWRAEPDGGVVSSSLVALALRPGNPKGLRTWDDLNREDLGILTPDPHSSGGAMWNIAAIHGAVLRAGTPAPARGEAVSEALIAGVLSRVTRMDRGARESMLAFEQGEGDVAITYESEILAAQAHGQRVERLIPASTLRVENPAAVLDSGVDAHGTRDVAEAFVRFLHTPEAQALFAHHGYRPLGATAGNDERFPVPADLFTIRDLGGWPRVQTELFDPDGLYERALRRAREAR